MKIINKCIFLFTLLIVLTQCDYDFLKPKDIEITQVGGTSSYKYSIYNPNDNAHIAQNYYTAFPVPITEDYLFNKNYVWYGTIDGVRYIFQFRRFYGELQVYSASASSIYRYKKSQIYEDRKLIPTVIYTNGTDWFMGFSPIFYKYENENVMDTNFNYGGTLVGFTNIKPGPKPLALKDSDFLKSSMARGAIINPYLSTNNIKAKIENTTWYSVNVNTTANKDSEVVTTNSIKRADTASYQFLKDGKLKETTGSSSDPSSANINNDKGWSVFQTSNSVNDFNSFLNYIYIYDIKVVRIFLNYDSKTDFSNITVNTNLDVLMLWYKPSELGNSSYQPTGPFTRYTVDRD